MKKLLEQILKELQEQNEMLRRFLTNNEKHTEDAMHANIETIDKSVDEIRKLLVEKKKKLINENIICAMK